MNERKAKELKAVRLMPPASPSSPSIILMELQTPTMLMIVTGIASSIEIDRAERQDVSEGMQVYFAEVHDKDCSDDLGDKFISVVEFAEVIEKTGDDKKDQTRIKSPHVKKRDEKEPGERNRKRHRKPADQGSRFYMYLSSVGMINQAQFWKRVFRGEGRRKTVIAKGSNSVKTDLFSRNKLRKLVPKKPPVHKP